MFGSQYFMYDDRDSSVYGLMLADFDDEAVVETAVFSPVLNTYKPANGYHFVHGGINYETPPQHRFSMISEAEIDDNYRRVILEWLTGRNGFKEFRLSDNRYYNYWYKCVFTDVDIIYIRGKCHGFRVTANFDSPYARIDAGGRGDLICSLTTNEAATNVAFDDCPRDGFVDPLIVFTGSDLHLSYRDNSTPSGCELIIAPALGNSGTYHIDCESRKITLSSGAVCKLHELNFNKQWPRIHWGGGQFEAWGNFTKCDIYAKRYAMIGF